VTHHIPQSYIGQISVIGEVFCYGLAADNDVPVYLDVAGPATSVDAVWAKLALGKEVAVIRYGGERSIYLHPAGEGQYARFQRRVAGLRIDHALLVHRAIAAPLYGERSATYVIRASAEQARAKLGAHVAALVRVAVFAQWHGYLERRGRDEGLVRPCACYGGVEVCGVDLDRDAWTRVIGEGLKAGEIQLPE
jgi:hypothetical protein